MEQDASKSIIELLGKINQYQNEEDSLKFPTSPSQSSQSASSMTELSDGKEQGKKNKVNIDENYFHHKLLIYTTLLIYCPIFLDLFL